jgi:hypothetical protein
MTVRVRFHLRRRSDGEPVPASALFVPGRDAAALMSVCTRLGLDPSGRVHDVADGFLLRLERPSSDPMPGATRLRALGADLFIPVDAELIPSLLDDEAAGLVRDGGLIFLPGGRVLRFDRHAPVALESLLVAVARPRREWRPMPEPPGLADRITEIARTWPEPPPEDLYREWEQDLRRPGTGPRESPDRKRSDHGEGDTAEGEAMLGETEVGPSGGLVPGLRGLGDALRGLIGRAGSGARSLGEKLQWGLMDHSALVQKLLREFRQGDPGRALRHALPMEPVDPRDRTVSGGDQLPWSRAIYNLFDLLGRSSRGQPVGIWQARSHLVDELRQEYRKAAELAIRQGDFRRAAYIYGRLLNDHRMAAQALLRGGLHHDAAILFLKRVNDRPAAARAFEAAGQADRAIALYRELGQHEAAGDLLRRIGDAGALTEYMNAVNSALEAEPPDCYEVGRLWYDKVGGVEPAIAAFRMGWDRRPAANATACAQELIAIHAGRGELAPLRDLLDEADSFFKSVGSARDAQAFYVRMVAATATVPDLAAFAEEVRDRAMIALAHHLRRQVEAGSTAALAVSALFVERSLWSSAFVRDAQFAAALAARSRRRAPTAGRGPGLQGVQVGRGTVTAACQASATTELFLGLADGKVLAFRPGRNHVIPVGEVSGAVAALSADPDGRVVIALRRLEHGATLTAFLRRPDGSFRAQPDAGFPGLLQPWLTPILDFESDCLTLVGLGDGPELLVLEASSGIPHARVSLAAAKEPPATALLLPGPETFRVLTHDGPRWLLLDAQGRPLGRSEAAWRPFGGSRSPRCSAPLSYTHLEGLIKVTGLDVHGAVYSSQLWIEEGVLEVLSSLVATTEGGYLAASQSGHSRVAAVSADRLDWLGYRTDRFQLVRTLPNPGLSTTVACFPSTAPEEVLVVSADGFVARIEAPRRVVSD